MSEYILVENIGWVQVIGPALQPMKVICINEGYHTVELITRDTPPYPSEIGVSLTTKQFQYQEATATLLAGEMLYVRVRGNKEGRVMVGEVV